MNLVTAFQLMGRMADAMADKDDSKLEDVQSALAFLAEPMSGTDTLTLTMTLLKHDLEHWASNDQCEQQDWDNHKLIEYVVAALQGRSIIAENRELESDLKDYYGVR